MKRLVVATVLLAGLAIGPVVSAHEAQSNSQISATLHVDPNDQPRAGEPSRLIFEFTDSQHQFNADKCVCQVVVKYADRTIANLLSAVITSNSTEVDYTFDHAGAYEIDLLAAPKLPGGDFMSFQFKYPIKVDRSTIQQKKDVSQRQKTILILISAVALSSLLTLYTLSRQIKRVKR